MKQDQEEKMKWIMFYVFLGLFVLAVLGTLGMVFFGFGTPTPDERSLMVKAFIGEIAAAVVALFYSLFKLKPKHETQISEENQKIIKEQFEKIKNLEKELESMKGENSTASPPSAEDFATAKVRKRIIALFGQGNELSISDILNEIYGYNYDTDQKDVTLEIIGDLVQEKLLIPANYKHEGYQIVTT
jgi:hypothetical protein